MAIAIAVVFVLLIGSMPLALCFGFGALVILSLGGYGSAYPPVTMFRSLDTLVIMAIPLFIFVGSLVTAVGIAKRLISFADALVGRLKGGLGFVVILTTMMFGSISGSSLAAIAGIGPTVQPQMTERGYPKRYTTALLGCSGPLGCLIPPSIPMIVYALVARVSVGAVFLAGVIPGIILGVFFGIINYITCRRFPLSSPYAGRKIGSAESAKVVAKSAYSASFSLFLPFIILGGIYGGIFTPTEAAAVGVAYAILVGFLGYRSLTLRALKQAAIEAVRTTGAVLVLLGFVAIFTRMLTYEEVPQMIASGIAAITESKYIALLLVNAFLIVIGMFMDDTNGTVLAASLLMPLMKEIGVSPIHFGAILATNLGMGLQTPPVAPNLFVAGRIANLPITEFIRYVIPFLVFAFLPVVIITTYVPQVAIILPRLIMGIE